jgi:hypothetical protein
MHPQSSNYYGQSSGSGNGTSLAGRALDTFEGIAGKDARKHVETLAQSKSAAERHSIIPC